MISSIGMDTRRSDIGSSAVFFRESWRMVEVAIVACDVAEIDSIDRQW